jgi:hypothetical protein
MRVSTGRSDASASRAHNAHLVAPLLILVGLLTGFVVGRWWALAAPAAFSVYVAAVSGVDEVPPWFLGVLYGLVCAAAVGAGILTRRFVSRAGRG